ncbi:TIGR02391 family protein [Chitinophaga alhagiae]|uniref:TIGR02391 family protein n=1 Tax=Chitinophaga alhagiae TaxID=2203219 RepID=UPI000E5C5441|nr:TIGR02391 family protein [Chitinophaga alhagiae]
MAIIPSIDAHYLEAVCKVIANTEKGLTGSEIQKLLADSKIDDSDPDLTKWKRLYNAFAHWQNNNNCSNNIVDFLKRALQPARYINQAELFHFRRNEINKVLSFIGIEISDRGTLIEVSKTVTLSEAEQRAGHFKYKLLARNIHPDIIQYCNSELLQENYFHSVFEAVKGVAERIRLMTGLYADGNPLVDTAFSTNNPLIRINRLLTDTDRSEHLGLMNSIKGLFGIIRNPTAHVPKILFVIDEDDALDIMTIASFIHKKLDRAL